MKVSTAHLESEMKGRVHERIEGTDDEINARWQAEDSQLSLPEARQRAHSEYRRRVEAIESVPGDRWDDVLEMIARADGAGHYEAHRSFIVVA